MVIKKKKKFDQYQRTALKCYAQMIMNKEITIYRVCKICKRSSMFKGYSWNSIRSKLFRIRRKLRKKDEEK